MICKIFFYRNPKYNQISCINCFWKIGTRSTSTKEELYQRCSEKDPDKTFLLPHPLQTLQNKASRPHWWKSLIPENSPTDWSTTSKVKETQWCHQLRWLFRSFCKISSASELTQSCPVQTEPISPWRTNIQSLWTVPLGTDKFHFLLNWFLRTEAGLRIERYRSDTLLLNFNRDVGTSFHCVTDF